MVVGESAQDGMDDVQRSDIVDTVDFEVIYQPGEAMRL
jgi:hypothetical protein